MRNPKTSLRDKRICVTGQISDYQGTPEIRLGPRAREGIKTTDQLHHRSNANEPETCVRSDRGIAGRKQTRPSPQTRQSAPKRITETMAAYGIPEADIARVLGVSK